MRILVTGGNGALGRALRAFLPDAKYLGREELDVTDQDQVWTAIYGESPNVVIHAAAITDHQCPDIGKLIQTNIIGTQIVANAVRSVGKMVYLSTHYVYPGERGNYKETDECRPIGNYAWTKYAGEFAAKTCPNHLIIRGSWYTEEKLKLWEKNGALVDAHCNRVSVAEGAEKIAKLVRGGAWGVVNIGDRRRSFAGIMELNGATHYPRIHRADLKLPYEFPRDSSVNTEKYEALGL